MTLRRPSSAIRVKALGLHWRDGCLLASEVNRDDGTLKGVRPQGETVEFGETWQDALIREFQEEIGVGVELIGDPIVLENIYTTTVLWDMKFCLYRKLYFPRTPMKPSSL
jgi:8-oxo-dGTP pyrophosphatase MutT (NUDIX family)